MNTPIDLSPVPFSRWLVNEHVPLIFDASNPRMLIADPGIGAQDVLGMAPEARCWCVGRAPVMDGIVTRSQHHPLYVRPDGSFVGGDGEPGYSYGRLGLVELVRLVDCLLPEARAHEERQPVLPKNVVVLITDQGRWAATLVDCTIAYL